MSVIAYIFKNSSFATCGNSYSPVTGHDGRRDNIMPNSKVRNISVLRTMDNWLMKCTWA